MSRPESIQPLTDDERERVEANRGLVGMVVFRWMKLSEDVAEDAIQDGMLGLMRAAQLYDPDRGFTFSTYAMAWIRQNIQRGRERREGRNFARARRQGEDYEPPMSLDIERGDGEGSTLHGVLPARDDSERDAVSTVAFGELGQRALRACMDDLDRALVIGLAEGKRCADIARETGHSGEVVRRRLVRLRGRLAHVAA